MALGNWCRSSQRHKAPRPGCRIVAITEAFGDAATDLGAAYTVGAATLRTVSAFAALAPEVDRTRVYDCMRDGA